jgi:Helix-turn-helix domain
MTIPPPSPKVVPIRPPSRALARFKWMAALLADPRYTAADKCILMRLALHQNVETGRLFVSTDRLARGTNQSERQAQRTIAKAGRLGSVTWTARRGRGRANFYNLKNTTPESYLSGKYDSGVAETPPKIRLPSRTNREDITGGGEARENRPTAAELEGLREKYPQYFKRDP